MDRPEVAEELERLASEDLVVRQRLLDAGELLGGYHPEMRVVHRRNGDRLTEIIEELGVWPGHRLVGIAGAGAALLIAQHDIANPGLMRRSRDLYVDAVREGDAEPDGLAFLEDRIRLFEGRDQRYGTQVGWNADGVFGPWPPVEDGEVVDELRAGLGMRPLVEAIAARATESQRRRSVDDVRAEHRDVERFAIRSGWRTDETPSRSTSHRGC